MYDKLHAQEIFADRLSLFLGTFIPVHLITYRPLQPEGAFLVTVLNSTYVFAADGSIA